MYLISYVVLFCYGGGGDRNHNNNVGKNYCNDAVQVQEEDQPQIGI